MFKSLSLQNFQSHKKSELEFSPGVNVIVGPTDSGKSAIIRALRWLIQNRPNGNEFNSNWGGDTSVELELDDCTITRSQNEKGSDKTYSISTIKNDFKAFGTDVPKEISEALNINEINFQLQLDSPFLLTATDGEVARYFNKIANLDKIDLANANIKKAISDIDSSLKHKQEDLKAEVIKLHQYDHLEQLEVEITQLEELEKQADKKQVDRDALSLLLSNYAELQRDIEKEQSLLELEPLIKEVFENKEKRKFLVNQYNSLGSLLDDYDENELAIAQSQKLISIEELVSSTIKLREDSIKLHQNRDRLIKVIKMAKTISEDIKTAELRYSNLHTKFEEELGDVCPLCETKLK